MSSKDRALKLQQAAKLREQQPNSDTTFVAPVAPSMPTGVDTDSGAALLRAKGFGNKLAEQVARSGLDMVDFLTMHMGISLPTGGSSSRTIKTPSGNQYVVVCTDLSHEELKTKCVVDKENVRHESERTREALEWLIDEISNEHQAQPALAYIDDDDKISFVDGSLRLTAAIFGGAGLKVDILDSKPTDEDIQWLVGTSDKKKVFSYYDKGKLYSNIMSNRGWSQAELCRHRKYSTSDVSRAVKFYRDTPESIKSLLLLKDCSSSNVDTINSTVSVIASYKKVDEFVEALDSSAVGDNVSVITELKSFAANLKNPKSRVKQQSKPVPVYQNGKINIEMVSVTKNKARFELSHVPEEERASIMNLINEYCQSKGL
ncbi:hypothetical protein [Vibrio sp. Hal054]|uniref:hypothetical protein n=1 Tax=Vibrio sp. Hal054 TaxID=3035158 RepID=UPI00301E4968